MYKQLDNLYKCIKCTELVKSRKAVVVENIYKAKIVFLGEAPGTLEDIKGEVFCGKAGQYLRSVINQYCNNNEYIILNTVKCHPLKNRRPVMEEIRNCRSWLKLQIETINPVVVCLLGKTAASTMLDIYDMRLISKIGLNHKISTFNVFYNYHPSVIIREGIVNDKNYIFKSIIKRAIYYSYKVNS